MTRSEAAAVGSKASAERRRIRMHDRMIAELRAAGRLADLYVVPAPLAVTETDAIKAFEQIGPIGYTEAFSIIRTMATYAPGALITSINDIKAQRGAHR